MNVRVHRIEREEFFEKWQTGVEGTSSDCRNAATSTWRSTDRVDLLQGFGDVG
jgi:hypothetical protein